MSDVNIPLLRKAVEWAECEAAKPAAECKWDQTYWVTPPSMRADHINASLRDPAEWENIYNVSGGVGEADCGTCYCIAGYIAQLEDERYADRDRVDGEHAETRATRALGLESGAATALFAAGNTIQDVRRAAEEIAGERL